LNRFSGFAFGSKFGSAPQNSCMGLYPRYASLVDGAWEGCDHDHGIRGMWFTLRPMPTRGSDSPGARASVPRVAALFYRCSGLPLLLLLSLLAFSCSCRATTVRALVLLSALAPLLAPPRQALCGDCVRVAAPGPFHGLDITAVFSGAPPRTRPEWRAQRTRPPNILRTQQISGVTCPALRIFAGGKHEKKRRGSDVSESDLAEQRQLVGLATVCAPKEAFMLPSTQREVRTRAPNTETHILHTIVKHTPTAHTHSVSHFSPSLPVSPSLTLTVPPHTRNRTPTGR
jgi:hypothetical protein